MVGRKKQPSPEELAQIAARTQGDEEVRAQQILRLSEIDDGMHFDWQVIDDEKILALFDKESPLYAPWLKPIFPYFSRLLYLSYLSVHDTELFKMNVDTAITLLIFTRSSLEDKILLNSLRDWISTRINDSIAGWKLRTLSIRERRIQVEGGGPKKKGHWWSR